MSKLKEQLQQLRKSKGLTQEEAALTFGVKLSSYQKYERDVNSPSYETLIKIADFYGVTTDYLLGRNTDEPDALDKLAAEFNMSALEKKIVENYISLPKSMRCDLMEFLYKTVKEVSDESGD